METAWVRDARRRRSTLAILAGILAVLSLWPRPYLAKAELAPEPSSGGLSAMLAGGVPGGALNLNALLGQGQSIEAALAVARSHAVAQGVLIRLHLADHREFGDPPRAEVKLRKLVNIEAVRGAIIQIKVRDHDPQFAVTLASAYAAAIQDRLATIAMQQTSERRVVAVVRLNGATVALAKSQAALTAFRETNKLAAPESQLNVAVGHLAILQGQLQAKQVELDTLLIFATSGNVQVKAAQAQVASLQSQIAQLESNSSEAGVESLQAMPAKDTTYFNLYRDERYYESLYAIYTRYLEAATIDELSAQNNLSQIEPAYLDPARQFNVWAAGLLFVVILVAAASEFYVLNPPVGSKLGRG
jgi:uncharacterized protein involved in exopolysaccharide biosynthesis